MTSAQPYYFSKTPVTAGLGADYKDTKYPFNNNLVPVVPGEFPPSSDLNEYPKGTPSTSYQPRQGKYVPRHRQQSFQPRIPTVQQFVKKGVQTDTDTSVPVKPVDSDKSVPVKPQNSDSSYQKLKGIAVTPLSTKQRYQPKQTTSTASPSTTKSPSVEEIATEEIKKLLKTPEIEQSVEQSSGKSGQRSCFACYVSHPDKAETRDVTNKHTRTWMLNRVTK